MVTYLKLHSAKNKIQVFQILVQQEILHNANPFNLQFNNCSNKIVCLGFMKYWLFTFTLDEEKNAMV